MFRLTCVKLTTGLENFKGVFACKCVVSDDLSFASVEIVKNYSLTLHRWKCPCQGLSSDQPQPGSFFTGERPREAKKRETGNELD